MRGLITSAISTVPLMVKGERPLVKMLKSLNCILLFSTATGRLSKRRFSEACGMANDTLSRINVPLSNG